LKDSGESTNRNLLQLRPATPADREGIIKLIDSILKEYGDAVFLEGTEADLDDIDAHYEPDSFIVLADRDEVAGTVALKYDKNDCSVVTLRRMYLHPALRGTGAATRMMDWALNKAAKLGAKRMELWTDTQFDRAQSFYKKLGFKDTGEIRAIDNGAIPFEEFKFYKNL
jgi:putative acetyltransferase